MDVAVAVDDADVARRLRCLYVGDPSNNERVPKMAFFFLSTFESSDLVDAISLLVRRASARAAVRLPGGIDFTAESFGRLNVDDDAAASVEVALVGRWRIRDGREAGVEGVVCPA